jgi:phosphoribosylaminoimidazolecarboxamide formyltransferase/IMP cyclohydrolase
MSTTKTIKSALISVYDKTGLEPIIKRLNELGVTIYSTGGTQAFVESLGVAVERVEDLTSYPSILGGRVKTLHPKVFGGILNQRDSKSDQKEVKKYSIPQIDLVIVDLYPFEETVADQDSTHAEVIEKTAAGYILYISKCMIEIKTDETMEGIEKVRIRRIEKEGEIKKKIRIERII